MNTPHLPDSAADEPLQWHPAFFQAIQAALIDYKDKLEFKQEYPLTTEPLRIDALIIVKPPELTIDKSIARIFKKINIWEYKRPGDSFSIKDFYKVYAYAALFASITPDADMSEMTLTFVGNKRPYKLINYLTKERQYEVKEVERGIYYVSGDYLPIQIIETKKLGGDNTEEWLLKDLKPGLEREAVASILKKSKHLIQATPLDAYLYVLLHANMKAFEEVIEMSGDMTAVEDVLMRTGILPKWINIGREEGREEERQRVREGARKQKQMGVSFDIIAAGFGLSFEEIEQL